MTKQIAVWREVETARGPIRQASAEGNRYEIRQAADGCEAFTAAAVHGWTKIGSGTLEECEEACEAWALQFSYARECLPESERENLAEEDHRARWKWFDGPKAAGEEAAIFEADGMTYTVFRVTPSTFRAIEHRDGEAHKEIRDGNLIGCRQACELLADRREDDAMANGATRTVYLDEVSAAVELKSAREVDEKLPELATETRDDILHIFATAGIAFRLHVRPRSHFEVTEEATEQRRAITLTDEELKDLADALDVALNTLISVAGPNDRRVEPWRALLERAARLAEEAKE